MCEAADLMLCTTHADDEQLFFAGVLPYYVSKGYDVQVVYAGGEKTDFHQATITQNAEYVPAVWEAADDGVTDVFFAQSVGVFS